MFEIVSAPLNLGNLTLKVCCQVNLFPIFQYFLHVFFVVEPRCLIGLSVVS